MQSVIARLPIQECAVGLNTSKRFNESQHTEFEDSAQQDIPCCQMKCSESIAGCLCRQAYSVPDEKEPAKVKIARPAGTIASEIKSRFSEVEAYRVRISQAGCQANIPPVEVNLLFSYLKRI